jgi:tetratricopeptide (TPR) repeat protein
MKRSITIVFTLILAMFFSYNYNASAKSDNLSVGTLNAAVEAPEESIQSRIMDAFMSAYFDKNNSEIESIIDELSDSYEDSGNKIFLYWKGYALYYNSVAYLQNRKAVKSNGQMTQGIELLESIENKNSDDYALLSLLHSFSCLFTGFPAILETYEKCSDCAEKALELDNNNIRAYYALATYDMYSGGKNVEKYLLKSLAIKKPKSKDPYLPTWGREEIYGLLTSYYIKEKKFAKAREYLDLGLKEFPNSYTLQENQSKLK